MADHDAARVDSIVRVDTNSILVIIRDLEAKLSDYHRQDKIPPWAESLVIRLDSLEQKMVMNSSSVERPGSPGGVLSGPGLTMSDLSNDERLLVKIRAALDNQMSTTRLGLESRMTAASFEMERLHKLLNIRPTTSEFQHVVSSVNDVQRKMFDSVDDITRNMKAIVQEKVTSEMDDIMRELRLSEESNKKSNELFTQKIEALSADIASLVGGDNSLIEVAVSRVTSEVNALREEFLQNKTQRDTEMQGLQYTISELKFGQDMTRETLNDFKLQMTENLARTEETVRLVEESMHKTIREADERAQTTMNAANQAKEAVNQLQSQYDYDLGKLRHASKTTTDAVTSMASRMEEIENYVKPQIAMGLNDIVMRQDETLREIAAQQKIVDEKMESVTSRMIKMSKSVSTIQEDLSVRIPEQFSRLVDRADRLTEEQATQEDNLRMFEGVLKQAQEKIGELCELSQEVEVTKEQLNALEETVMRVQTNLGALTDSNTDHENRLGAISASLSKSEEGVAKVIDEMRESLFDLIMEKQAEIDADVKNLRENLEIMSAVNDGTVARTVTTQAVATGPISERASLSRGGARTASAHSNQTSHHGGMSERATSANANSHAKMGSGGFGGGGGDGMAVVSQGSVNMQHNFSRRGTTSSSGGAGLHGHGGTMTTAPGQDSRLPSAGDRNGMGNDAVGQVAAGMGAVGYGLSMEEQRAISSHHAKLMAELCESYEDISVRKTNVPALPSTMCEQITATAQVMTAFISTYTDAELVQKAIRNQIYDAGDIPSEDFNATERREMHIEEFIVETLDIVAHSHPQTGLIRLDAREKFTKQLKKALMMCMSKHDQVLLLGNSRLGRIKIPSCIACDRPLLDKVSVLCGHLQWKIVFVSNNTLKHCCFVLFVGTIGHDFFSEQWSSIRICSPWVSTGHVSPTIIIFPW